jgi:hypothetical protein
MKRITIVAVAVLAIGSSVLVSGDQGSRRFQEFLDGFQEAANPVSTIATGTFNATISKDETEIAYELTFSDLEGDVRQAHIHLGYPQNSGNIVLWLCQTAASPSPTPATTPQCTQNSNTGDLRNGRVTGTLTAADVVAQTANGIAAGEFSEVVAMIRAGRSYVNVHSAKFAPGEIRSQINNGDDDGNNHGNHH